MKRRFAVEWVRPDETTGIDLVYANSKKEAEWIIRYRGKYPVNVLEVIE